MIALIEEVQGMGDKDDCLPSAAKCPDDGISKERFADMGVDYPRISANAR